jgi:hypothetical protein
VNRLSVFLFVIVLPLAAVSAGWQQRQPNRPPSIESFTSSLTTLQLCPFNLNSDKPEVTLLVKATDPDGDSLHYEYSSTEGTITGEGKSVVWNLDTLPRGPHEIRVTVSDGRGGKADGALTVTTVDLGVCDPPPPPCPVIKVSCPDAMQKSKPFIFSALVEADAKDPTPPSSFYWRINAGRIVKGQNSREIEVTATGANGFDNITATVEVGGFDPACPTTASGTTRIIW